MASLIFLLQNWNPYNGVNRLITAISSSYRDEKDKFQFGFDFGVWMLKLVGKNILKNIIDTGDQVIKSSLDWTLVRLPVLTSKPAKDHLNIGYTGDGKVKFFSLTRADLADFLIKQIDDKIYLHQSPVISN